MVWYAFGDTYSSYVIEAGPVSGLGKAPILRGGVDVTFWTADTGGSQITALRDAASSPITEVTTLNAGSDYGYWPLFYAEDRTFMWGDANGGSGPRFYLESRDEKIYTFGDQTIEGPLTIVQRDLITNALNIFQPNTVLTTGDADMLQLFNEVMDELHRGFWSNEKGNPRARRQDEEVPWRVYGRGYNAVANANNDIAQFFSDNAGSDFLAARIGASGGIFGRRIETDTGPNQFAGVSTFTGAVVAQSTVAATGAVTGSNLAADLTIGAQTAITIDSPTVPGRYSANAGITQYAPSACLVSGHTVQLSGRIEHAGGATTSGDVMATDVGAGFRPAREVNLPASQQGGAAASISIATNGNIIIRRTTTQTWTSLDNISYRKAL